jgi:hypothetical protein
VAAGFVRAYQSSPVGLRGLPNGMLEFCPSAVDSFYKSGEIVDICSGLDSAAQSLNLALVVKPHLLQAFFGVGLGL